MGKKVYLIEEYTHMILADLPKGMRDNILANIAKILKIKKLTDRMEQKFLKASLANISQFVNLYDYITIIY